MSEFKVWIKKRNSDEQAFEVDCKKGVDFDDLKEIIPKKKKFNAEYVMNIYSMDSDDQILAAGLKVPMPKIGEIGCNDKHPYYFSTRLASQAVPTNSSYFVKLHTCIMKENKLTKKERIWTLEEFQWMDSTNGMLIRDSWMDIASILLTKKHAIIRGKAGRGKSLFLLFLIFEILLCAKNGATSDLVEGLKPPEDVIITYVDRSGIKHLVTVDGAEIINNLGWPAKTSYCFSDEKDICDAKVGSLLTLAVTSGDEMVLKEFTKRMDGINPDLKIDLCMPSLALKEMALVFPDMNAEERKFKFDVVGGNPRKFTTIPVVTGDVTFYGPVKETLVWMFGEEYIPSDDAAPTPNQRLGRWAIELVVGALTKTESSFFKEFTVRGDYTLKREQFASMFLSFVAGKLREKIDASVMNNLKHMFGWSGLGCAFEYTSHFALDFTCNKHICWSSKGRYMNVSLGGKRKVLIRTIEDIKTLEEGERGVPTICNFPFVDEIIPPNMGVQFTTSATHVVPVSSTKAIIEALSLKSEADFTVVFMVPRDVLPNFKFPSNLGSIKMCVTIPEAISDREFRRLRLGKKRKRSNGSD